MLFLFLIVLPMFAQPEVCPRAPIGGEVIDPASLASSNARLEVDFTFRTYVDRYGQTRYCYLSKDNLQAPTLRVHAGDELVFKLTNGLPEEKLAAPPHVHQDDCAGGAMTAAATNLHFHGLALPPTCHQDETLRTLIRPSASFEYRVKIPAGDSPGLYWYHPHPHGYTEPQVLGGASGALIIEGIERVKPEVAGLPERVLVLRDQSVPGFAESDEDSGPGKDISINFVPVLYPLYRPAAMTVRPGERQFWRVLNASADTYFDLQIRFGQIIQDIRDVQTVDLVAFDGVPIGGDARRTHMLLSPGGRGEFIVTTPPAGTWAQLVTLAYDTGPDGAASPYRVIANIRSAADAPVQPSMPSAPAAAKPFSGLERLEAVRERKLYFSEKRDPVAPNDPNLTKYFITVEGATPQAFDMNFTQPDITVEQGTVEDWIVENRAREAHSFHIHQLHFQLLERDGEVVNEPMLRDTIDLPYWDGKSDRYPSVKLRMDFRSRDIVGTFVYHCHILEHEDGGMMGSIRVAGQHKH
ncbi:MAG TPA: multicopper oxidase family protein [Bryobacteraceae bacterium]|nr:multicopper oxidase family protein [Bryobacteraceae bacterium]